MCEAAEGDSYENCGLVLGRRSMHGMSVSIDVADLTPVAQKFLLLGGMN